MRLPVMHGRIDRRILVNYRVDPEVLAGVLPAPFRPKLCHGYGMAGICLIRLRQIRPGFMPGRIGLSSENAAHRIAVEWDQDGVTKEGVFISRRDTSSRFNTLVGGRLFPGVHHHARFHVQEDGGQYQIKVDSDDTDVHVVVAARRAMSLPSGSLFSSLTEASEFFEQGSLGYSPSYQPRRFDGLELRSINWSVEPLEMEQLESSYFDNPRQFPAGSLIYDSALLMLGIDHEWHERATLCSESPAGCVVPGC